MSAMTEARQVRSRLYISGPKGVITRSRLKRVARRNRRGKPLKALIFRTGHGVAAIGLYVLREAPGGADGSVCIEGRTLGGDTFTGSYNPKIGFGPIDVTSVALGH